MPSIGQSSFQGNSPQCSKQISEWEVITSHQTPLPANCWQRVALPVSLYSQLWQTASQLFGGLFLFWKSSRQEKDKYCTNKNKWLNWMWGPWAVRKSSVSLPGDFTVCSSEAFSSYMLSFLWLQVWLNNLLMIEK